MDLNWCSPIGHVSFLWLLSKIWFVFGFQKFNYDASWPEFLWVYSVCSASWICRFVCFLGHVWRVFSHISLNNLSATLSSSILRLWWFECWIFCNYSPHPGGSAHFFFFWYFLSIVSVVRNLLICAQIHWLYPRSSLLSHWAHPLRFSLKIFLLFLKLYNVLWFFQKITLNFAKIVYCFHLFQENF